MATTAEAFAFALQHHQAGRLQAAESLCRQIIAAEPGHAEAFHLLGAIAHQSAKLDEAVAYYRRAIELQADFALAYSNLGLASKEMGELPEAIACWRRAVEIAPDYAEAWNDLGIALRDQCKPLEAEAAYRRAIELKPEFVKARSNLGNALNDQGRIDEAIACYRRALELSPDYAEVHNNLGNALEAGGDLQEAEASYRAALRHKQQLALAHYNLATLLGGKLPDKDLAAQRRLLAEGELPHAQRLLLHFGLAHVLDARGEYAEAADHLQQGNALQLSDWRRRGREYDPAEHERFVDRMIAICSPDFFERCRGFGLEAELPVFVVGLPRSGTTLVEQILASHSLAYGAGETRLVGDIMTALGGPGAASIDALGQLDRETTTLLALQHVERLRALHGTALRIVDKAPDNYLFLGLLAVLFPRAKIIHCRRDLRDVGVSCWMTHFREISWANDPRHMAPRFHQYRRLMQHWRTVLPVAVLEIDYETVVADLEAAARQLVAWCGLEWEAGCLEFHRNRRMVRTASAVQVRQPVYSRSVGRWRHYEKLMAELLSAIQPE